MVEIFKIKDGFEIRFSEDEDSSFVFSVEFSEKVFFNFFDVFHSFVLSYSSHCSDPDNYRSFLHHLLDKGDWR